MAQSERERDRRAEPGRDFPSVLVLNDQGGARMDVTYDVTAALRAQMGGHPPLVFDARGNGGGYDMPDHNRGPREPDNGLYGGGGDT